MEKLTLALKYIITFFIGISLSYFLTRILRPEPDRVYIRDTTIVGRYKAEIKSDTVVRWYEKIIYKKNEPDKVSYQEIKDTVFIENFREQDVMIHIKKEEDNLAIRALNQDNKLLKEYIYTETGKDFTAVSRKNNISVKSKSIYWNGINMRTDIGYLIANKNNTSDKEFRIGLETGVNYLDRYHINCGIEYMLISGNLFPYAGVKWKMIR